MSIANTNQVVDTKTFDANFVRIFGEKPVVSGTYVLRDGVLIQESSSSPYPEDEKHEQNA